MKPLILIVHSDHHLDPVGPNSGAEMATLNQARYFAKAGFRTAIAAHLTQHPVNERYSRGVDFWQIGAEYDVEAALDKADKIGPYILLCAGKSVALFFARRRPNCKKRLLVTHDRSAGDAGIKPTTLSHVVDTILCVSFAQRDKLIEEGAPAEKMVVIHNGVDFSFFHSNGGVVRDSYKMIFSGALVPDKGLHLLINSYLDLKPRYPQLSLDVYGSASLWARGEYLDIDTLARSVPGLTFHGKQSQTKIADGMRSSGICVVPSIWFDPYPLTSLEAQACGAPVVAFNVGGLPEGIKNGSTGIVVDQIEQSALTAALNSLLENPERLRTMSTAAAAHALEQFRWESVIEKILALCADVEGVREVKNRPRAGETEIREWNEGDLDPYDSLQKLADIGDGWFKN